MERRGPKSKYTDEELYTMWVACQRNGSEAARRLGISPNLMTHHVKSKDFERRYASEFVTSANGVMRIAIRDMMIELPNIISDLVRIIRDDERDESGKPITSASAKVKAIEVYLGFLPKTIPDNEPDDPNILEGQIVPPGEGGSSAPLSVEDQVRDMLEANIVSSMETRSRTKA